MSNLAPQFDYAALDKDARVIVQQKTTEIRDRMGRAAQNIVEIGERLTAVKESLGHGRFGAWLRVEFDWSGDTAQRMMNVAEHFKNRNLRDLAIAPSALYLLASPSTPEAVRDHFITEAQNGKPVTHAAVKESVTRPPVTFGDVDEGDPFKTPRVKRRSDEAQEFIDNAPLRALEEATAGADAEPEEDYEEVASLDEMIAAGKRFACIMADPPWQYGNQATRAATDNHYPTMTIERIAELPIGDLAADRCHLWLWTTNGFLFECPKLFDAWGFEFKSSYVWCKTQMGIGNYLRNAHEFLLLATRGGLTGAARDVRSWGEFPRGAHSAKPERIRVDVVERVSPGPRLELFGRRLSEGWTVWGNQIEKGIFDAA